MVRFSVPVAENVSDMPCNHVQHTLNVTCDCGPDICTDIQCLHCVHQKAAAHMIFKIWPEDGVCSDRFKWVSLELMSIPLC